MRTDGSKNKETASEGRGGRIKGWLRRLSWLAGGLLVLLSGLYLTRQWTLHPLLVKAAPAAGRMAGLELSLEGIEGDWRHSLALTGIRIDAGQGSDLPLRHMTADRVAVEGSLLSYARDPLDFSRLKRVVVERPDVTLRVSDEPKEESPGLGPIVLPEINVADGKLALDIGSETLRFESITIDGKATQAAPLRVAAQASGEEWEAVLRGDLIQRGTQEIDFEVNVPEGSARDVRLSLVDLAGSWSPEGASIRSGALNVGENHLDANGLLLRHGPKGPELGGRLTLECPDLAGATRAIDGLLGSDLKGEWSGALRGTVDLEPASGQLATGSADVTGSDVTAAGVRLGALTLRALADQEGIRVESLEADDGLGAHVSGTGAVRFAGEDSAAQFVDVVATVRLDQPGRLSGDLERLEGVEADITLGGPVDSPSGTVRLMAKAITQGALRLSDVSVDGTLQDGVLTLPDFAVTSPYGSATGGVRIELPLGERPLDLLLSTFALSSQGAELRLAEPVAIHVEEGEVTVQELVLTSGAGKLTLDVQSDPIAGVHVSASANEIELEPFVGDIAARGGVHFGALNGTATFHSEPLEARVDLRLRRSADASYAPVSARVKGTWDGSWVDLDELLLELPSSQLQLAGKAPLAAGPTPFTDGPINLQGRVTLDGRALCQEPLKTLLGPENAELCQRIEGRAFAALELGGTWEKLTGTASVDLESATMTAASDAKRQGPLLPAPLSGSLGITLGDRIELARSGLRLGKVAEIDVEGHIDEALSVVRLFEDSASRLAEWRASPVEADADLDFQSLDWIARFMPELRETGGTVKGTVRLRGTIDEPSPTGTLTMTGGTARYRGLPPLENAEVKIAMDPGQVTIESAEMEIGAAPVSIRGNVLHGQGAPRIDATVVGTEVLLARSEDARLRANLDLTLKGRTNAMTVAGDVALVGGRLRSPIEFQSLLSGGDTAPLAVRRGVRIPALGPETVALDVRVTTADPVRVKGRIARGELRADLRLAGTAAHPTPIGRVFFDPLELAVPAGSIEFPTGLITFDPDSPDIPRIDLVGTTRLAGYDVTVNVEGEFDRAEVELSSSPPLAPEDLLLLVLSGQPPSSGGGIEAAGQSVALYVAKDLVRGWFSSGGFEDEDKESFLDRLEVTTGRDVSRSGTLTLEATYKIREGLAREKDAIYVVLERDAYEDYGLGLRLVLRLR